MSDEEEQDHANGELGSRPERRRTRGRGKMETARVESADKLIYRGPGG
jgi:hypothetical protein